MTTTRPLPNPFTPTFGFVPSYLAGREKVVNNLTRALQAGPGNPDLSSILMGARGTGKTVLLSLLADEAPAYGWVAVNVSACEGMLEEIIDLATQAADDYVASDSNLRLKGINVAQLFGLEWEYRDPSRGTWRTRMNKVLDSLAAYDIGLLLTVDEVQANLDEMVKLVSTYQHFVRERRRVALFMAGLPQQVSQLLNEDSVTFLRRASLYHLDRIPDYEIRVAIEKTVTEAGGTIESIALDKLVCATDGYPYMMQLAGYRSWEHATGGAITDIDAEWGIEVAREEMDHRILAVTYDSLSPKDQVFLEAMSRDSSTSLQADIAKRMGVTSGYASEYKRRLIEQGVIEERARGVLAFAIPGMRDYVLRMKQERSDRS